MGAGRATGRRAALGAVLFLVVLILAAGLRLVGLDWDHGHLTHPDERRILIVLSELHWPRPWDWSQVLGPRSPLNPRFFAYGSLPLYLLRLLGAVAGTSLERLVPAGRALSASFDLLTVAAVYALGRRLQGQRVGLLAAAFAACAVLSIQLSHFLTVDTLLTLLTTLAVGCLLQVARSGSLRASLGAGALTGLALATKTSALPLLLVNWVAWAVWALGGRRIPGLRRGVAGLGLGLGTAAAALTFLLAQPYALLDWFRFGAALAQESAMAQGTGDLAYTRQYIGTLPYLYHLRELVLWSLGLPLGLLALAGVLWLSWRALRRRRPEDLVFASWFWSYFVIVGAFQAKFSRYMAPLIPWLCLAAALLLLHLWQRARGRRWPRRLTLGLGGVVLVSTLLYALAFAGLYVRPHPWVQASDWIRREVPPGAVLAVEYWDDSLPIGRGAGGESVYDHLWLDLYPPDDEAKLDHLVGALARADCIILASQRLYATIGRLPERYPLTAAYYRLLFAEKLGFRLVDVRTNYPRLGPVAIVDEPLAGMSLPRPPLLSSLRPAPLVLCPGRADESFSVYDHPRTLIFRKETSLAPAELKELILSAAK